MRRNTRRNQTEREFEEKVVKIRRVSKKTKGGNQIGFSATMVIGDRKGRVGVGMAKAKDVVGAIRKASKKARKTLVRIPMIDGTIPHEITIKQGAAKVMLKPAPKGTGVIAGGAVRAVVELAGITNIVSKVMGTNNQISNVKATYFALSSLKSAAQMKGRVFRPAQPKTIDPIDSKTKKSNLSQSSSVHQPASPSTTKKINN